MKSHQFYMKLALEQAQLAFDRGEVPVGAVLVKDDAVIASAHNLIENQQDTTAHAEMLVIQKATQLLQNKYLTGCTLYVTLEPCIMCSGALIWSKIDRIVFGAMDAKVGACGSRFHLVQESANNHHIEVIQGILETESEDLLKRFFIKLRNEKG